MALAQTKSDHIRTELANFLYNRVSHGSTNFRLVYVKILRAKHGENTPTSPTRGGNSLKIAEACATVETRKRSKRSNVFFVVVSHERVCKIEHYCGQRLRCGFLRNATRLLTQQHGVGGMSKKCLEYTGQGPRRSTKCTGKSKAGTPSQVAGTNN